MEELIKQREELARQQAALDAEIKAAQEAEKAVALADVKAKMLSHGLTVEDLAGKGTAAKRKPRGQGKAKAEPVTYRFHDGSTYTTGKAGKPPRWVLNARADGVLESFRVE